MKFKELLSIITVTMLTVGTLTGCGANKPNTSESNTATKTDIVVVGAGGAGLAAAVEAKTAGANIIVLEKMPMVGGNTLRATGGINAAGD